MRVVAVDPGVTSGVAIMTFPYRFDNLPGTWELSQMETIEWASQLDALDVIVCESFIPRPGAKNFQPASLEIIGALRYVSWLRQIPFVLQSPADAKRFSTNEKLKTLGWYQSTVGGHANDAQRHLLLYAIKTELIPVEAFV